jgi:two-component system, chemotaxis family, chemotaxis protein CheY
MSRVLVVEDAASTRAFVRAVLEDEEFARSVGHCDVVLATSGFDATRLLPRGHYDLIITDINMADINGLELIHFIRKSDHHKATPLVIISTQNTERDIERGLALGANAYLPKPFTAEGLRAVVQRYLTTKDGLTPESAGPVSGPPPGPVR